MRTNWKYLWQNIWQEHTLTFQNSILYKTSFSPSENKILRWLQCEVAVFTNCEARMPQNTFGVGDNYDLSRLALPPSCTYTTPKSRGP